MDWIIGTEVNYDVIKRWIEVVNYEFGLSEKNDETYAFMVKIKDGSFFYLKDWGYCVAFPNKDLWGNLVVSIVSFYISKECRDVRHILEIERSIEDFARSIGADYIEQGSHFNDKLFKVLEHLGYSSACMRKGLK